MPPAPSAPLRHHPFAPLPPQSALPRATSQGAVVAASLTKKVTHLLSTDADVASKTAKIVKAMGWGITIVAESFVVDSIAAGAPVALGTHILPRAQQTKQPAAGKRKTSAPAKAAKVAKKAAPKAAKKPAPKAAKKPAPMAGAAAAAASAGPKRVDDHVPNKGIYTVHGGCEATLNQVNLGSNNNKFYSECVALGRPVSGMSVSDVRLHTRLQSCSCWRGPAGD
eukprot:COSAG01_NODE_9580_length_2402_cov_39.155884_2_plen_224_part_00